MRKLCRFRHKPTLGGASLLLSRISHCLLCLGKISSTGVLPLLALSFWSSAWCSNCGTGLCMSTSHKYCQCLDFGTIHKQMNMERTKAIFWMSTKDSSSLSWSTCGANRKIRELHLRLTLLSRRLLRHGKLYTLDFLRYPSFGISRRETREYWEQQVKSSYRDRSNIYELDTHIVRMSKFLIHHRFS